MSNIVIIETIDEIEIIKGIDKLQIDPVVTREIIRSEIVNTDAFIACKAKQDEMNDAFLQASDKMKLVRTAGSKISANKFYKEYSELYNSALELMKEVKALLPAVKQSEKELYKTHAVYFEPGHNEKIKTDTEIAEIKNNIKDLTSDKLIKSDGTLIDNLRGRTYFHKVNNLWFKTNINKVGEIKPNGGKLFNELSELEKSDALNDINFRRIASLPKSEKDIEKQNQLNSVLNAAARKRSKLEIQNVPDALEQSQQWYNAEVAKIEELYK